MQCIVPYTTQQNGVVERRSHMLKEMDNYMIQSKLLSLHILNYLYGVPLVCIG